jgi:hypothetical protein
MRSAALILGVAGGIFGVLVTAIAFSSAGIIPGRDVEQAARTLVRGQVAVALMLLGLVGTALTWTRPSLGAGFLLVAAFGLMTTASWSAIITASLFLMAAALAFLGRKGRATPP